MTRPWLLVVAGGITFGAVFGPFGVAAWTVGVAVVSAPGRSGLLALTVAGAIAASVGAMGVAYDEPSPVAGNVIASTAAEGEVVSIPQSGPSGPRAVVRVARVEVDGVWQPGEGNVLAFFRTAAPDGLGRGDRLRLHWFVTGSDDLDGSLAAFVRSSNAGASAMVFHASVLARGDSPQSRIVHLRERVTSSVSDAIPDDAGALVAGFVTGDDSGLSERARDAFDRTGMSHITAVSGSNVAVLVTLWLALAPSARLRRSLPALIAIVAAIWLYALVVGFGPGVVRAGLMATLVLPSARFGRGADPLTALLLASALMVLVNPAYASNVGFQLSLAGSLAIVLCVNRQARSRMQLLRSGVVALLAAQLATLPILLSTFGGWSPASISANLLIGPIVSGYLPIAFVTALLVTVLPWLGSIIAWLPALGAEVVLAIVEAIGANAVVLRLGAAAPMAIWLVSSMSVVLIFAMSGETRRWLRRLDWRWPRAERWLVPVVFGVGAGAWLAVIETHAVGS